MPRRNKTGPPKGSTGPRDGRGKGRGYHSSEKGIGKKQGGKKGSC